MKIRIGFVSNSSSCSFCIYGIHTHCLDRELEKIVGDMGLSYTYGPEGDSVYIGREWSEIGDDETGKQFKDSTQEKINNLPIDNKKCSTHEEGWFDG